MNPSPIKVGVPPADLTTSPFSPRRSLGAAYLRKLMPLRLQGMIRVTTSITGQHWLYDWIDEYGISDASLVEERWRSSTARSRFIDLVSNVEEFSASGIPDDGVAVAGIGLNIGSRGTCGRYPCRSWVLDHEYPQLLHYFDSVVMEGPSARTYAGALLRISNGRDEQHFTFALSNHVALMLHMRRIGLSNYTIFKPSIGCLCPEHTRESARMLNIEHLLDDDAILQLARETSRAGRVSIVQNSPREWYGSLDSPQFAGSVGAIFEQKTKPKKYQVALTVLSRQLDEMIFDSAVATQVGAPLAALGEPSFFSTEPKSTAMTVDDVALRVRVPILQGFDTERFIRFRELEYEHFKTFQTLLAEAIAETIDEAKAESPEAAADIVWKRKIQPQLVALEQKIASSKRALTRKLIAGATAGAASVGIGSLTGALVASVGGPLGAAVGAAVGGLASAPSAVTFVTKHIEEKQEFERAGTYFLWKARKATEHA